MKEKFILGYYFGILLFFITSQQNGGLVKIEEIDVRLLKNEILIMPNVDKNSYEPSIYDVVEVTNGKKSLSTDLMDIKTKKTNGENSIYVEALQQSQTFRTRPNFNHYDSIKNQFVKEQIMLKAYLTCSKQIGNLSRQINKKDKSIKFDKKYNGLFKKDKNYEKVFSYNLYLERNLGKTSSKNKIKQGESKLFKRYKKKSMDYLRENLFQNPCIIKSEKCKYLDTEKFVTIYYDELTDLFAIVDLKTNYLLDFGIASQVQYAEIFAYKSLDHIKQKEICSTPSVSTEYLKSKKLQVYQEQYVLNYDDAIDILKEKYGSNFLSIGGNEFKIEEWQAVKKIEHAICFGLNPEDFNFSQDEARNINTIKGGIVDYVRKGNRLPSLDLIRSYQNAIKDFCEDRNKSVRNDTIIFRGEPSIAFFNQETRQIAIFDQKTKVFITAYKLAERQVDKYIINGNIGNNQI